MTVRPEALLGLYILLRLAQHAAELWLGRLNLGYALDPGRRKEAAARLRISDEAMEKSLAYAVDRYRFGLVSRWIHLVAGLSFLLWGGLGLVERLALSLVGGQVAAGLVFFLVIGALTEVMDIPLDAYHTFVIEERHGFNRQTVRGFITDRLKGWVLGALLGGLLLSAVLWIMGSAGASWWLWAWAAVSAFSLLTAWAYPVLLAPLFNRFSPLPDGELKERIEALAQRVGFRTRGISVMDASRRSSHGNAYFTGLFGEKRIVLFDTLVQALTPSQVTAVLAHELGHFKLHHVRWQLIRGVAETGLIFFLLSRLTAWPAPYAAFGLGGPTSYGALTVFGLWFGLVGFILGPIESALSRRHERAADAFATRYESPLDLGEALLRLREESRGLPLSHPLYSAVYHSHPPLLERLEALGVGNRSAA